MWLIFSHFRISLHRYELTTIQEMSCFHQIITHVHETMMTDLYYFLLLLFEFFLFYFPFSLTIIGYFFQQNHSSGLPPNDWLILWLLFAILQLVSNKGNVCHAIRTLVCVFIPFLSKFQTTKLASFCCLFFYPGLSFINMFLPSNNHIIVL